MTTLHHSRPTSKARTRESASGDGRGSVLFFLLRFALYSAAAVWLVSHFNRIEQWGIGLTVVTLERAFALIGKPTMQLGSAISAAGSTVDIVAECSPHMPFLILAAAVLAFPATWRQRLLGLGIGAVLIHAFNTLRIMTLMWILAWQKPWFDIAHVYLWQTGTVLVVFVGFALWLHLLSRRTKPA